MNLESISHLESLQFDSNFKLLVQLFSSAPQKENVQLFLCYNMDFKSNYPMHGQ